MSLLAACGGSAAAPDASAAADGGVRLDAAEGGADCAACDDGNPCTRDVCADAGCTHLPEDDRCGSGERCATGFGCSPVACVRDEHCSNGLHCDGVERCAPTDPSANPTTGCAPGEPIHCDDGMDCSVDRCDETTRRCTSEPDDSLCSDDVDCTRDVCGGAGAHDDRGCSHEPDHAYCSELDWCVTDAECNAVDGCVFRVERSCDDGVPCTLDVCDRDARACVNRPWDLDGDGSPAVHVGGVDCVGGTDCDDSDPDVFPHALEACDGQDDDCDGAIDERCDSAPDNCSAVEVLTSTAWPIEVTGSFARLSHDYRLACLGIGLPPDAVYAIDITAPSDVRIVIPADAPAFGIGIGDEYCPSATFGNVCAASSSDEPKTLLLHGIEPMPDGSPRRIHILVAETPGSTTSTYRFSISIAPRPSSVCGSPIEIGPDTVVRAWFASGDEMIHEPRCAFPMDAGRREHVYRVDASASLRAEIPTATFAPQLEIRRDSCGGAVIGCLRARDVGDFVSVDEPTTPGSHLVIVDGGNVGDSYRLRVD